MSSSKEELLSIINKYNRGTATPEEILFLEKYYQYFDKEEKISQTFSEDQKAELGKKMFSVVQSRKNLAPVVPMIRRTWFRIAAASVLVFFAGSVYFVIKHNSEKPIAKAEPQETRFKNDVAAPATVKATITLSDGRVVPVDSLTSLTQSGVNLTKTADGKIIYSSGSSPLGEAGVRYNTLSNPRGSKVIDMKLSDGSHVWLNAGSSITYPVAFMGNERKVSINGEAYFEVAKNTAMPFKVKKGDMTVTVLGTHFNVNAFDDEREMKITLLEGSVKVATVNDQQPTSNQKRETILTPGQQAVLTNNGQLTTNNAVDVDEVMSWKNGKFYFDGADIKTMMRQLSRWYDVDVEFKAEIRSSFVAKISRDEPVTELLKILELTNLVHFKIEGNKIEVIK